MHLLFPQSHAFHIANMKYVDNYVQNFSQQQAMAAMGNTSYNQLHAAHSPWANGSSATEDMQSLLWNTHFNIILQSSPMSLKWSLPFRFSDKYFAHICHFCQAQDIPPPFQHHNRIWWKVQSTKFLINIYFSHAFIRFLSHSPNVLLVTMFSSMGDHQTSHAPKKEQQKLQLCIR